MKYAYFIASLILLCSCSSQRSAKYTESEQVKFSSFRDYSESPQAMEQPIHIALRKMRSLLAPNENDSGNDSWVYSYSRDKYLLVKFNGVPKRIALKVRRKLNFKCELTVAGSRVTAIIEEQIENLDKDTGVFKSWRSVSPDESLFPKMFAELDNALRSR